MKTALHLMAINGWALLILIPNETWRLYVLMCIAPMWAITYLGWMGKQN